MRLTGRALSLLVIIMAIVAVGSLVYAQVVVVGNAYDGSIKYTFSRLEPEYDYSCNQPVYGLYVSLWNNGSKTVSDFSVTISNPLCKGAVPPLPDILTQSQELNFYVYSSQANGTVTVSGNNTLVQIRF